MSDDLIKRLKALEAFLRGEEPLRGANFGDPNPALHKGMFWWRNYLGPMDEAAAALADAQATIARQQVMLDRALEGNGDMMVRIWKLEAALREARGMPSGR